eukprot:CAMPEP_0206391374 /NCGR_PEP_ID=MMETSP0294-20121207/19238_1 /ASSEMBLY_ACC=CAM_ASM_000327 /TAXON_ID=39354 /ORGANISM="Heterosigma akashiwo, Strain CCMP2393" /LENGTH=372 /DNA_ID=CAMNT_0053844075 /DNA_START=72 /DNA_END=1186 /DNA_ORIENTATION=-
MEKRIIAVQNQPTDKECEETDKEYEELAQALFEPDGNYKPSAGEIRMALSVYSNVCLWFPERSADFHLKTSAQFVGLRMSVVKNILLDRRIEEILQDSSALAVMPMPEEETATETSATRSTNEEDLDHFISACKEGEVDLILKYISEGMDVNLANSSGNSGLNWAALRGHNDVVRTLLQHGAYINHAGPAGWTPIYSAAYFGHHATCRTLLDQGADVHIANNKGKLPGWEFDAGVTKEQRIRLQVLINPQLLVWADEMVKTRWNWRSKASFPLMLRGVFQNQGLELEWDKRFMQEIATEILQFKRRSPNNKPRRRKSWTNGVLVSGSSGQRSRLQDLLGAFPSPGRPRTSSGGDPARGAGAREEGQGGADPG